MVRTLLHNILKPVGNVTLAQDLKGHIAKDTLVIQRLSNQSSVSSTLGGWSNWVVYIYTPNSPLTLDRLAHEVIDILYKNGFEITNALGGDFYDEQLKSYMTAVSCRNPNTII